ncbi:hypothetical protein LTR37_021511 [Vermiconidia calcicola]|uniref:Uncharacterized protein n=1 Tax=Vermiconidia calcicola TaxID=1690605 RepID=A0ACC3M8D4_9PEZI|nr:hypothetical protein LTR37_021511 [Vermiconidia calcicola]
MVFAPRKAGVTHETFKERYEQHMRMIANLCGDASPVSHKRWYLSHDSITDNPILLSGGADQTRYSAVVVMEFENEAAWGRFYSALSTDEAKAKIDADEAGFWERDGMKVMVVEGNSSWGS